MSRGINAVEGAAARVKGDFYPTPLEFAKEAMGRLILDGAIVMPGIVVDPGCGTGVWGQALRYYYPFSRTSLYNLAGVESDQTRAEQCFDSLYGVYERVFCEDYLNTSIPDGSANLVIGNPPYGDLAEPFARKSLEIANEGGYVFLLYKASFWMGSAARATGLFSEFPPLTVYKVFPRPFNHAEDYCMILWRKEHTGTTATETLLWK